MRESVAAEGRPLVGDVIAGKYRIENVAGEGGMGIVYEAEHVILRQRVAVKALLPGAALSAGAVERFSLEASAIARIQSDHVVRVMDAGTLHGDAPYLVMEYLDGCDLAELLERRGRLPPAEVVDFALQALEGLAHAHAAHVIHRDLKPANLFLARASDGREIVKLVDFGIAQALDFNFDGENLLGSPMYMSPEQLSRSAVDLRTDLWSLGVVLYEMLCGTRPFVGTFSEVVSAILHQDATPLGEKVPSISADLSRVIARCLQRDPLTRWSSTAELARALVRHGTGEWNGAVERIDRVLSRASPVRSSRRYESFDNALQALESGWESRSGGTRPAPPDETAHLRTNLASEDALGATIPVPSSTLAVVPPMVPLLPSTDTLVSATAKPRLRILLIDDSPIVLAVHARVLTDAGFETRTTTSARELDALLDSWKPHLVLMDVQMPGLSGDILCQRVKARFRATVPVVFVSDLPRDELARRASRGGADAFFSKTNDFASFVGFIQNLCAITYSPEDLP